MNTIITLTGLLCAGAIAVAAADLKLDYSKLPAAADKKGVTFAKDIKPLFEKGCFKCHGPEKQKGDIRLDSLEAALKDGENGKTIVPGKSEKSPLVWSIGRLHEDIAMPPEGKADPFTKEQVALVRAWIDQGAK